MSKPTSVTLRKADQKQVVKMWKTTKNARRIAEALGLPRHQVMYFLENQGVCRFSEGSYR
jgi:hypothetical protein